MPPGPLVLHLPSSSRGFHPAPQGPHAFEDAHAHVPSSFPVHPTLQNLEQPGPVPHTCHPNHPGACSRGTASPRLAWAAGQTLSLEGGWGARGGAQWYGEQMARNSSLLGTPRVAQTCPECQSWSKALGVWWTPCLRGTGLSLLCPWRSLFAGETRPCGCRVHGVWGTQFCSKVEGGPVGGDGEAWSVVPGPKRDGRSQPGSGRDLRRKLPAPAQRHLSSRGQGGAGQLWPWALPLPRGPAPEHCALICTVTLLARAPLVFL